MRSCAVRRGNVKEGTMHAGLVRGVPGCMHACMEAVPPPGPPLTASAARMSSVVSKSLGLPVSTAGSSPSNASTLASLGVCSGAALCRVVEKGQGVSVSATEEWASNGERWREGRTCSTFARHSCSAAQQHKKRKTVWRAMLFC